LRLQVRVNSEEVRNFSFGKMIEIIPKGSLTSSLFTLILYFKLGGTRLVKPLKIYYNWEKESSP